MISCIIRLSSLRMIRAVFIPYERGNSANDYEQKDFTVFLINYEILLDLFIMVILSSTLKGINDFFKKPAAGKSFFSVSQTKRI